MSPPEAIPNDVIPFHLTEEQQCKAIRERIHMVVNGYRNTVPPTRITKKKYSIRFLPVSLIAACLAVGFSEREIINVHLYFLIAVPVLGYYVFKQVQSGDGFIHVTPGEKFWRDDIISDADILLLSENAHIRDWLMLFVPVNTAPGSRLNGKSVGFFLCKILAQGVITMRGYCFCLNPPRLK